MCSVIIDKKTTDLVNQSDKACNFFREILAFEMGPETLLARLYDEDIRIIDIRDFEDYVEYRIAGAVSIPLAKIREQVKELADNKTNIIYSRDVTHTNVANAALILAENGCKVTILAGGFDLWIKNSNYHPGRVS